MAADPYRQYQKVRVETADRGALVLMLYEGALRFLGRGRKSLQKKDLEGAHNNLLRAQDIITELMASLDLERGGEIAVGLFRLYDYMYRLLLEANLKKDPQPLEQVEMMLFELRDTWKEALGEKEPSGAKTSADAPENLLVAEGARAERDKIMQPPPGAYAARAPAAESIEGAFKQLNIMR